MQEARENLRHLFGEYELDLPCTDSLETLEVSISALEKQIAVSRTIVEGEYFCPRCKYVMRHPGYCRNCGQHAY